MILVRFQFSLLAMTKYYKYALNCIKYFVCVTGMGKYLTGVLQILTKFLGSIGIKPETLLRVWVWWACFKIWVETHPLIIGVIWAVLLALFGFDGGWIKVYAMMKSGINNSSEVVSSAAAASTSAATSATNEITSDLSQISSSEAIPSTSSGTGGTNIITSTSEPISSISTNITTSTTSGEAGAVIGVSNEASAATISQEEPMSSDLQTHGCSSPDSSDIESDLSDKLAHERPESSDLSSISSGRRTHGSDLSSISSGRRTPSDIGSISANPDLESRPNPHSGDTESVSTNPGSHGSAGSDQSQANIEQMDTSELGRKRRHGNEDVIGQKQTKFLDTSGLKEALPEIVSPRAQVGVGEGSLTSVPRAGITAEQLATLPKPSRESMASDTMARYFGRGMWWKPPELDSDSLSTTSSSSSSSTDSDPRAQ